MSPSCRSTAPTGSTRCRSSSSPTSTTRLDAIGDDNDTWVVVLTGSGRAFTSGLDLKDYGVVPNIDGLPVGRIAQRAMRHYSRLVPLLRRLPQPVIAAVNGPGLRRRHVPGAGRRPAVRRRVGQSSTARAS